MDPWVEQAVYAAECRNHWWQHVKDWKPGKGGKSPDKSINPPDVGGQSGYFKKTKSINDVPASDSGGNFGRLARVVVGGQKVMGPFLTKSLMDQLCGIEIGAWIDFFNLFTDASRTREKMLAELEGIRNRYPVELPSANPTAQAVIDALEKTLAEDAD